MKTTFYMVAIETSLQIKPISAPELQNQLWDLLPHVTKDSIRTIQVAEMNTPDVIKACLAGVMDDGTPWVKLKFLPKKAKLTQGKN